MGCIWMLKEIRKSEKGGNFPRATRFVSLVGFAGCKEPCKLCSWLGGMGLNSKVALFSDFQVACAPETFEGKFPRKACAPERQVPQKVNFRHSYLACPVNISE